MSIPPPQPVTSFTASKSGSRSDRSGGGRGMDANKGKSGAPKRRQRRQSEYGAQLAEKQQTKRAYGLRERQFKRYFLMASTTPASTGETLLQLLETRLDNVVFRLGYGRSLAAARQLVTHGHIQLNGRRVSIPSQAVTAGDTILVKLDNAELGDNEPPAWLQKSATDRGGTLLSLPTRAELPAEVNEQLIVEFYSR